MLLVLLSNSWLWEVWHGHVLSAFPLGEGILPSWFVDNIVCGDVQPSEMAFFFLMEKQVFSLVILIYEPNI